MLSDLLPWSASAGLLAGTLVGAQAQPTLKDAFKNDFLVGAALNQAQVSGQAGCAESLIPAQFNSISPENVLKWGPIHPTPKEYNFGPADAFVEYGLKHHMFVVGHTLVWQHQTPRWVFEDDQGKPVDRETLLARMREHVSTVVGRYQGKVNGWDVVNEALEEDGTLRQTPWLKIIGEDYVLKAFQFAREADPRAELYYNDYSLENAPKRKGAIALIRKLQSQGVKLAAVGLQGHYKLDWPKPSRLDQTIRDLAGLGVKVMITELDMDVLPPATQLQGADLRLKFARNAMLNPYTNGLPAKVQQALAKRYAELFTVLVRNRERVSRVTLWGVTDAQSWLNHWPVPGRRSYPLLFDRECQPKPAFTAVIETAGGNAGK